jgi:hypothetical protein
VPEYLQDRWTITLFPTMPIALLAVLRLVTAPALVVVDEDSVLQQHVATSTAPQQGYIIRTFAEQRNARISCAAAGPTLKFAVHRTLDALLSRMDDPRPPYDLTHAWNHVEDLAEDEIGRLFCDSSVPCASATVRLHGYPAAVAVALRGGDPSPLMRAAVVLGLSPQDLG